VSQDIEGLSFGNFRLNLLAILDESHQSLKAAMQPLNSTHNHHQSTLDILLSNWTATPITTIITPTDFIIDQDNCFRPSTFETVPSLAGRLAIVALYTLTALASLLGNLAVIIVQVYGPECNHSLHSCRKYLINLAVTDLILGVFCVPFTYMDFVQRVWIFPHWLCPTAQFVQLASVFITSMTLTIIGIER